jgi:hypothetical protein
MDAPAPDQRELLRQARRASLMKVWATGSRRLSAEERAEIADLINEPAPAEAPPLEPRAEADTNPEATADKVRHWSELYGTSRRPLFKWIAIGREKHDPCPLDHPERMPMWWAMHMKHRVPQKILAAARSAMSAEAAAPGTSGGRCLSGEQPIVATSPTTPVSLTPPDDLFAAVDLDFETQVKQMRGEQARIQRQLDEARRGKLIDGQVVVDQPAVESLLRQRLAIQEPLRKAEGDLTAWLQQRGLLAPRDEVRAENNRIASAICSAVLRLVRNVRPQLAGKSPAEQDRIWHAETLACFSALKTAKFATINLDELTA